MNNNKGITMDAVGPNIGPRRIWWRDVRRSWPIYVAGLFAMFITSSTEVLAPKTLQWIIDALVATRREMSHSNFSVALADASYSRILKACGLFVLVAVIGLMGRVFWRFTLARMTHVAGNSMKQGIWQAIRNSPLDLVGRYTLGDLMNRSIGDVNSARWIYGFTLVLTCDVIFFTVLGSLAMILIHPPLAIACLASFSLIPFVALKLAKREYHAHELAQCELTVLSENVSQSVRGLRAQRASNSFYSWVDSMTESARRYAALRLSAQRFSINSYPLCSLPTLIAYAVLFIWGPKLVINNTISVGEFAAFGSYVYLLQGPLAEIGDLVAEWQKGFASLRRILEIRDLPPLVDEENSPEESPFLVQRSSSWALITAENVSITRGEKDVFSNITFEVKSGEWLGISGPVGCGKSSLLQCMAGLLRPTQGSIKISGRSVSFLQTRQIHTIEKSQIVYAPEKPFVFAGSIQHNLCLNQKFSEFDLWSALDAVCLGDEVRRMPSGLDNLIGEGGVSLSGGQLQRLALARIILRASKIVLLDDPLSAVDVSTEAHIVSNLRKIWPQMTVVFTSSKPSTLDCCDRTMKVANSSLVVAENRSRMGPRAEALSYV